jgi:hypothetical protein
VNVSDLSFFLIRLLLQQLNSLVLWMPRDMPGMLVDRSSSHVATVNTQIATQSPTLSVLPLKTRDHMVNLRDLRLAGMFWTLPKPVCQMVLTCSYSDFVTLGPPAVLFRRWFFRRWSWIHF